MDVEFRLDRFAYHYVDPRSPEPVYSPAEQDMAAMPEAIQDFLFDLVAEIWDAPDAGSTRSARFAQNHERLGDSEARPWIEQALAGGEDFFAATRELAALLHRQSPQSASPGVLGVIRLVPVHDDRPTLALIKIRHRDEAFVHLGEGELPRLEVEQVERILLKDIQKGALAPHPEKSEYDLKVIDSQARDDPAAYFTEKFLGCDSKKSDDLQIKKLVPMLERYARERELPIAVEKVSGVIEGLRQQSENISAPVLAEVVAEQALFGDEFTGEDFTDYVEESELGELDIPAQEFQHNRRSPRRLIYRFVDPEYEGLEISGPPEAFSRVMSSKDGVVQFTITVTPDGFQFNYR